MVTLNRIGTGNSRELSREIPDDSVDLVFTDPPYLAEFLPEYEWLAKEALRVLKPGGYLYAYAGAEYTPQVLKLMDVPGLEYFWQFVLLHHGAYPRMWAKHLMSGYKPVFVYTKGKPAIKPWRSTVGTVKRDKRFHKWGQGMGFAIKTIDLLTPQDGIVFDPFCGGGTTAAAAKITGRNWYTFDIDPQAAEIAQQRLDELQPLPMIVPAQAGLDPNGST